MKHTLLQLAVFITCIAIRRYGWQDTTPPPPFRPSSQYPWWRRVGKKNIETSNFSGAIHTCIKEMMKSRQPVPSKPKLVPELRNGQ